MTPYMRHYERDGIRADQARQSIWQPTVRGSLTASAPGDKPHGILGDQSGYVYGLSVGLRNPDYSCCHLPTQGMVPDQQELSLTIRNTRQCHPKRERSRRSAGQEIIPALGLAVDT